MLSGVGGGRDALPGAGGCLPAASPSPQKASGFHLVASCMWGTYEDEGNDDRVPHDMEQDGPYYAIAEDQKTGHHAKTDGDYCHQYGGKRGVVRPVESVGSPKYNRGEHYKDWGEKLFARHLVETIAQGCGDGKADYYALLRGVDQVGVGVVDKKVRCNEQE